MGYKTTKWWIDRLATFVQNLGIRYQRTYHVGHIRSDNAGSQILFYSNTLLDTFTERESMAPYIPLFISVYKPSSIWQYIQKMGICISLSSQSALATNPLFECSLSLHHCWNWWIPNAAVIRKATPKIISNADKRAFIAPTTRPCTFSKMVDWIESEWK